MPLDLLTNAFAIYPCGSFGDDTDGNLIWNQGDSAYDLTKGDGSTAGTFPTFVDLDGGYYAFDGSNDYVSDWAIPDGYFISAVFSDSYNDGQPYVTQETGTTVKNLLTVSGAFTGNLHSLVVFETEPTTAEKLELANYQTRALWRDLWVDPWVARQIRNGDCVLWADFEHPEDLFNDYAGVSTLTNSGFTWGYGLIADDQYSKVTAPHSSDLQMPDAVTLFFSGDFESLPTSAYAGMFSKGSEYDFYLNKLSATTATFTANLKDFTSLALPRLSVCVVIEDGELVKLYVDGEYVAESSTTVTLSTGTNDVLVGNSSTIGSDDAFDAPAYRAGVFNRALTDEEVRLLHYSADRGNVLASDTIRARVIDVDGDDEIISGQTNVVINCQNAGATEGKVWLTDEPVFDESTIQTEQSIDSWADGSIQFDVDDTGF